jgi:CRISPR-associated protein Cas2
MCEIAPGVYTAPKMTAGVRDRVWTVLCDWFRGDADEGIVMTWVDRSLPGGQAVRTLGMPQVDLVSRDGIFLARKSLSANEISSLTTEQS